MVEDRIVALKTNWTAEKIRVMTWFDRADEETRNILLEALPRLHAAMRELKPENMVRYDDELAKTVSCIPTVDTGTNDAAVCKPESSKRVIEFFSHFCTLPAADLRRDCKVKVIIHECSHYIDTFDSLDNMYGTGKGLEIWTKGHSDKAVRNADNIACYVAHFDGIDLGTDASFYA